MLAGLCSLTDLLLINVVLKASNPVYSFLSLQIYIFVYLCNKVEGIIM